MIFQITSFFQPILIKAWVNLSTSRLLGLNCPKQNERRKKPSVGVSFVALTCAGVQLCKYSIGLLDASAYDKIHLFRDMLEGQRKNGCTTKCFRGTAGMAVSQWLRRPSVLYTPPSFPEVVPKRKACVRTLRGAWQSSLQMLTRWMLPESTFTCSTGRRRKTTTRSKLIHQSCLLCVDGETAFNLGLMSHRCWRGKISRTKGKTLLRWSTTSSKRLQESTASCLTCLPRLPAQLKRAIPKPIPCRLSLMLF